MHELITFIGGMIPFAEFRGAAVFSFFVFDMPFDKALAISTLGGITITIPLILFWYYLGDYLKRRFQVIERLFHYTHQKHKHRFEVWEALALFLFVAAPLPGSGVWGSSLVAYVFNFPKKKAIWIIILGMIASSIIYYILIMAGIITLQKTTSLFN